MELVSHPGKNDWHQKMWGERNLQWKNNDRKNNKSSGWPKPGRDNNLKKENEPLQASRWACPVDHDGQ